MSNAITNPPKSQQESARFAQTSGGQGIRTGCENTGETDNSENRETQRTRSSQLPEFE